MRQRIKFWISIGAITYFLAVIGYSKRAYCLFGEEIPFLIQLITHAIHEVHELQTIVGNGRETIGLLQEMNRGVKDVLKLAETAHVTLPPQVYADARQIATATQKVASLYGRVSENAPLYTRTQYRSGVEGLFMSEDAFQYTSDLDLKGTQIKRAAVTSSQATATRLSAESLGVILHAVNHQSRLEAKQLEIQSTHRIEEAAKEDSRFESFQETHEAIHKDMNGAEFFPLNSYGSGGVP